jgi:hypothetical protein
MTATSPISIRSDIVQRAERNARTLGLSVSEYLSRLVLNDPHPARKKLEVFPVEHGWGPVPKHVQERWDKDIKAFEEEEKCGSTRLGVRGATSAQELRELLEAETAHLTHGKDN